MKAPCHVRCLSTRSQDGITTWQLLHYHKATNVRNNIITAILTYHERPRARDLGAPKKTAQQASFIGSASSAKLQRER